ncbi:MAG: hypothetical protein MJB12_00470, partial [Firmicutes bacterium]|nr:hypothetical protein [Bacillota bacterium]
MGKYRSKMICMVAVVFFIILIGGGSVTAAGFAGGSGTIADPYLISTAQQLDAVRSNLSAHYKLTSDIDLSGYSNWEPIGSQNAEFVGSLDGDGHTIRNLSINRPDEHYVGLFGCIEQDASFKDIKIIVGDKGIKGKNHVGALIGGTGFTVGKIKIEGCSVEGPGIIEGYGNVGGLVGYLNPRVSVASVISNCKSAVDVSATSYGSGGLIGSLMYGTVTDSFATGNVICTKNQSGGLIGTVKGLVTVSKCYATGHASGYRAGGLVGGFSGGRGSNITIENSFALGEAESIDAA